MAPPTGRVKPISWRPGAESQDPTCCRQEVSTQWSEKKWFIVIQLCSQDTWRNLCSGDVSNFSSTTDDELLLAYYSRRMKLESSGKDRVLIARQKELFIIRVITCRALRGLRASTESCTFIWSVLYVPVAPVFQWLQVFEGEVLHFELRLSLRLCSNMPGRPTRLAALRFSFPLGLPPSSVLSLYHHLLLHLLLHGLDLTAAPTITPFQSWGWFHRKWVSLLTHVQDRTQLSVCSRSQRCFFPPFAVITPTPKWRCRREFVIIPPETCNSAPEGRV